MKLKKRVKALESTLLRDPIVFYFADGTTRELRAPRYFMRDLLAALFGQRETTPWQAKQFELIRQCVGAREPGGSHMVEVVQMFLNAKESGRNDAHSEYDESEGGNYRDANTES